MSSAITFDCVLGAWREHETELLRFLAGRCGDATLAEDLLQDVFIKAMRQGEGFCRLDNPRAWLFRVARTTLIDHGRLERYAVELDDDLFAAPSVAAGHRWGWREEDCSCMVSSESCARHGAQR